ncbi:MAG: uroporphyrinogen decarboxylase family protein [Phycisphaerae bacterium]
MGEMTSRERILAALNHREPDHIPYDLAGTHVTGITNGAYQKLRSYVGLPKEEPRWLDAIQQVVIPGEDLLDHFKVDTRGLYPLCAHNWDVMNKLVDSGTNWKYRDEWGCVHDFPKTNGHWFSITQHPLPSEILENAAIDNYRWPVANDPQRFAGLRQRAQELRAKGKAVLIKSLCAGLFEMSQRLRGMENALIDSALFPEETDRLYGKIADLKIAYWDAALAQIGDLVDIVVESDDYGTQQSQLISVEQFRAILLPHWRRVIAFIKSRSPHVKFFFHSCGNVRPFLPDFIAMGVDILNPVHITAVGMEPAALKRDFGSELIFWGGGVETQSVLPYGTPQEVRDNVRRNIEALAPGGGFVFNTVHNIQSEIPPENIVAMWEALQEYGHK